MVSSNAFIWSNKLSLISNTAFSFSNKIFSNQSDHFVSVSLQSLSLIKKADIIPVFVSPCSLLCVGACLVLGFKNISHCLGGQGNREKPPVQVIFKRSLTLKILSSGGLPKSKEDLKCKSDHIPLAQLALFQFNTPNSFPLRASSFSVSGWIALSLVFFYVYHSKYHSYIPS